MSEWKEVTLGDIGVFRGGVTSIKREDYGFGTPFITYMNIFRNSKVSLEGLTLMNVPERDISKFECKYGDIFFTASSETDNEVAMSSVLLNKVINLTFNGFSKRFRLNNFDTLIPTYARYLFRGTGFRNSIQKRVTGDVRFNISQARLSEIKISLPSIPEQEAIAEILSSLDDKIDLLHRQNKTLEQMAETLFRQWFVIDAKDDWEEITVGQLVELNARNVDKHYPFSEIEYLDTGALTEGEVDRFQTYNLDESPSRAKRLVQHNDVLVSTVRPNQRHYGIVKEPVENLVVSTGFCVITCKKIDPHFIYLLLTNNEMTEYLHSIAEGSTSTYPSLKPSDIDAIEFKRPPDSLLTNFAMLATDSWEKIQRNQTHVKILENLRNTLLPKLMIGKTRVRF